jgi:hypothetical protein
VVVETVMDKEGRMATTFESSRRSTVIGVALILLASGCTSHSTVGLASADGSRPDATSSAASPPVSRGSSSGVERPVVDGTQLSSGRPYRVSDVLQDIDVVFTGPSTPAYGAASGHRVAVSLDKEGRETVLSVVPIANLRVFTSPDVVLEDVEDELASVTTEAPADIVTWMAARPFLSTGPVTDGLQLGGLTGRGFDYVVGDLSDRAAACGGASTMRCAATFWASGVVNQVSAGERGRILELDAAGQRLLVQITDGAVADDLLASLQFELWPTPKQAADAVRLPYFSPSLSSGQRYLIDKVSKGLGLVTTAPTAALTASQRHELVWFGEPDQPPGRRHYDFVAVDAATAVANSDSTLDPYAIVGPGGIALWQLQRFLKDTLTLPDDPMMWLVQQPYVEVVRPVRSARVGGVVARIADVRVRGGAPGILCPDGTGVCAMPFAHASDAFPMTISSEYVTRAVELRLGEHRLLMTADLGTPGEAILARLCAFEIERSDSRPACTA